MLDRSFFQQDDVIEKLALESLSLDCVQGDSSNKAKHVSNVPVGGSEITNTRSLRQKMIAAPLALTTVT